MAKMGYSKVVTNKNKNYEVIFKKEIVYLQL